MKKSVVFNSEKHEYHLGKVRLPSVTGVLKHAGHINFDPRFVKPHHAERGSYIHKCTVLIDLGVKDWEPRYPELEGYLDSYRKFIALTTPNWNHFEQPRASKALGYAGTADREFTAQGVYAVWDIKTGSALPWHPYQLAAYTILGEGSTFSRRYGIHLQKEGSMAKLKTYNRVADFSVWRVALEKWKACPNGGWDCLGGCGE